MKDEKISVVIPIYNVEKYLHRCIDSVLKQSYENIEVILVDDGSTDNSVVICDEYALKDKRIKVIHKNNGGMSDARNFGMSYATGDYLYFIDSDDYIDENMLEMLYTEMINDGSDMAICNFLYVDERERSIEERNNCFPIRDGVFSKNEILEQFVQRHIAPYTSVWNKLYKRKIFEDITFPYGKTIEDAFVAIEIVDKCTRISCVSRPLYYYVQRCDSVMGVKFNLARLDGVEAFAKWADYAMEKDNLVLAIFSVRLMIAWMIKGLRCIDQTKEFEERFDELKKIYLNIYKKITRKAIGIKCRMQFLFFRLSPCLYNMIAYTIETVFGKELYNEI